MVAKGNRGSLDVHRNRPYTLKRMAQGGPARRHGAGRSAVPMAMELEGQQQEEQKVEYESELARLQQEV